MENEDRAERGLRPMTMDELRLNEENRERKKQGLHPLNA